MKKLDLVNDVAKPILGIPSAQHTPGPWSIETRQAEPDRIRAEHNGWDVADVFSADTPHGWANARLIAAAPELLGALEELGQATAPFIARAIGSRNPTVCAAVDRANKAIAEARGR